MALISLKCPSCAGDIELDGSREFGFCMYCGSKVMITKDVNNISIEMSVKDQRASLKPLALAYCKRREFAKAEEIARKLVSANAADADIWTIDGLCRLVSGDVDGGLGSLEKGAILSGSDTLEEVLNAVADGYLVGPAFEGDRDAIRVLATAYSRIGNPGTDSKAVSWYLRYIGDRASEGDSEIVKGVRVAEIPSSVTSISDRVFESCESLASVSIPSSVTSIGDRAFCGCKSLVSVSIPSSVTSIGEGAFNCCNSLASVSIPSSVTFISDRVFESCESLASVSIPSSVTSIGDRAFCGCKSLTSVSIPSSVTSIGEGAFYCCISLVSVSIPSSVTSIGDFAFRDCDFDSVSIPRSVNYIGQDAFPDRCKILREKSPSGSDDSHGGKGLKKLFGLK